MRRLERNIDFVENLERTTDKNSFANCALAKAAEKHFEEHPEISDEIDPDKSIVKY